MPELSIGEAGALRLIRKQPCGEMVAEALLEPGALLFQAGRGTLLERQLEEEGRTGRSATGGLINGRAIRLWVGHAWKVAEGWGFHEGETGQRPRDIWHERLLSDEMRAALPLLLLEPGNRALVQEGRAITNLLSNISTWDIKDNLQEWIHELPEPSRQVGRFEIQHDPTERIDTTLASWKWIDQSTKLHGNRPELMGSLHASGLAAAWKGLEDPAESAGQLLLEQLRQDDQLHAALARGRGSWEGRSSRITWATIQEGPGPARKLAWIGTNSGQQSLVWL